MLQVLSAMRISIQICSINHLTYLPLAHRESSKALPSLEIGPQTLLLNISPLQVLWEDIAIE